MRCTECGSTDLKTHDTRQRYDEEGDFAYAVRVRRCKDCGHRFKTIEVDLDRYLATIEEELEE